MVLEGVQQLAELVWSGVAVTVVLHRRLLVPAAGWVVRYCTPRVWHRFRYVQMLRGEGLSAVRRRTTPRPVAVAVVLGPRSSARWAGRLVVAEVAFVGGDGATGLGGGAAGCAGAGTFRCPPPPLILSGAHCTGFRSNRNPYRPGCRPRGLRIRSPGLRCHRFRSCSYHYLTTNS